MKKIWISLFVVLLLIGSVSASQSWFFDEDGDEILVKGNFKRAILCKVDFSDTSIRTRSAEDVFNEFWRVIGFMPSNDDDKLIADQYVLFMTNCDYPAAKELYIIVGENDYTLEELCGDKDEK